MTWQTQVPLWVLNAVTSFLLPDDVNFTTNSSFAALDEVEGLVSSGEHTFTVEYPGLVPNITIKSEAVPATNGLNVSITVVKAVGFYGILSTILSFDPKALNRWEFPLVRRNFGYLSMSRASKVSHYGSILYDRQYHIDNGILLLASNYDQEKSHAQLTNNIDNFSLDRVDVFQYPSVVTRIGFLPILEEWAVKFFQTQ